MPDNHKPIFAQTIRDGAVTIQSADGTNSKQLFPAGTNGSLVDMISVTSDSEQQHNLKLSLLKEGVEYPMGVVAIASYAGNNSNVRPGRVLDLSLLPYLNGDGEVRIAGGSSLQVSADPALPAGKTMSIVAMGGDF